MKKKKITKAMLKKKEKRRLRKKEKRRLRKEDKQKFIEWRKKVLERDCHTCQISGKQTGGNLHVHHILDRKNFPQFRFEVMNGIALNFRNHKVGGLSPHMNSIYFSEWLKEHKPLQWNWAIDQLINLGLLKK
jgi:5-methylcytosine-specific restriction endonuclease McrA